MTHGGSLSRALRATTPAAAALVLSTCAEGPTGPGRAGYLAVQPAFHGQSDLAVFNLAIEQVRVRVVRPPDEVVADTTVSFPPDASEVRLAVEIALLGQVETFDVTVELSGGGQLLFSGTRSVEVHAGLPTAGMPPAEIAVSYVGPGANVAVLTVEPDDSVVSLGGELPFRVSARDATGADVPQFYVAWSVSEPQAAINALGVLRAPGARGEASVSARTPTGVSDQTRVTFVPLPRALVAVGGPLTGLVGSQVELAARVIAEDGLGVKGIVVRFRAVTGGGTVADAELVSDAEGLAGTTATLGSTAGAQVFEASATGLAPLDISVTAVVATATRLTIVSGDGQSGPVGQALAPLTVRGTDDNGNPASGEVAWAVLAGGGSLSSATTSTDLAGLASVVYTTGTVPGPVQVEAQLLGTPTGVTFRLTAVAGPPAALAFVGPPGSGTAGQVVSPPFVVEVRDRFGNRVQTASDLISVSLGSNPSGALLTGTTTQAAVSGQAVFDDLRVSGAGTGYTLVAAAPGLTGATSAPFNVVVPGGVPVALAVVGQPTSGTVGQLLSPPLVIELRDIAGARVSTATNSVTVALGTSPGGAILRGTTTRAAVAGLATFDDLTVSAAGAYTLVATSPGLSSATSAPFSVAAAVAGQIVWAAAVSGNWTDPTKWSPARVPGNGDTVTIAIDGAYTVSLDGDFTVARLTVGGGIGTQTLAATARTLTVSQALTVAASGIVDLTSSTSSGPSAVNLGVIRLNASTFNNVFDNQASLLVEGASVLGEAPTTGTASFIRVAASTASLASLTVPAGFVNDGAIELSNDAATARTARLDLAGTLVNNGAIISSPGAAGGTRELAAVLDNQNVVSLVHDLALTRVAVAHRNGGSLDLSGGNLTVTGAGTSLTNLGVVLIGPGHTLKVESGAFVNDFDTQLQAQGAVLGGGTLDVSTGTLTNRGFIDPGFFSGILTVTGDLDHQVDGELLISLDGTTPGVDHDRLDVSGTAQLDGVLDIEVGVISKGSYQPALGDAFEVMRFGSRNGAFGAVNVAGLFGGITFDTLWTANSLTLVTRSQILFAGDSAVGSSKGQFRVNPDGTDRFPITTEGGGERDYPRWAPDRSRLTYTARDLRSSPNLLHVASPDGIEIAHVVSDTSTQQARFSPDGLHLAFQCGDLLSLLQDVCVVANVDKPITTLEGIGNGAGKVFITDQVSAALGGSGAFAWHPTSPGQLAVVRDSIVNGREASQFWLVRFDGVVQGKLTPTALAFPNGDTLRVMTMDWSPDGSFIAFDAVSQVGVRAIYRLNVATGSVTQLTFPAALGPDARPAVSPDASQILFARSSDGFQLLRVPAGGGTEVAVTPLLNFSLDQAGWDWSPDGLEIVHTTDKVSGGGVVIARVKRTTTSASYASDLVLVGRAAVAGEVQDRHPSWRP